MRPDAHCGIRLPLRRGRIPWASIKLLSGMFSKSELVRYDGPLSVLRSYTPAEARGIFERAGLRPVRIERRFPYRMAIVFERDGRDA